MMSGGTMPMAGLSHVILNTGESLANAVGYALSVGFNVSPESTHSVGTKNRTIVLDGTYIELLSSGDGPQGANRIVGRPGGLAVISLRCNSADSCFEHLTSMGVTAHRPLQIHRTLSVGGEMKEAEFSVVRCKELLSSGVSVFFCEHRTPAYIWPPRRVRHVNGALDIVGLSLSSTDRIRDATMLRSIAERQRADGYSHSSVEFALSEKSEDLLKVSVRDDTAAEDPAEREQSTPRIARQAFDPSWGVALTFTTLRPSEVVP